MPAGRPTKPTAIKILQGTARKHRLPKAEPQPRAGAPTPPAWLTLEARAEWRRISRELLRLGLLTVVDRAALAAYCQSWARWVEAERVITERGLTFESYIMGDDGPLVSGVKARPEVAISQRERQIMRLYLVGFGLDPASRSKIDLADLRPPADPMAALLD